MFEGLQMSLEHVVPESYIVLTLEEPKYELWMNFSMFLCEIIKWHPVLTNAIDFDRSIFNTCDNW